MADETIRDEGVGLETREVDGSHLVKALEQAGHAAGKATQEEIDRLMGENDVEEVDHTREIDIREVQKRLKESS